MPQYILKIEGRYLLWSTVVDAPITFGASREGIAAEIESLYGTEVRRDHEARMDRVERTGTSAIGESAESVMRHNRAGPKESDLSLDEIAEFYVRRRENVTIEALAEYRRRKENKP